MGDSIFEKMSVGGSNADLIDHTFGSPGESAKLICSKNVDFSSQEALQIKKVLNTGLFLNMLEFRHLRKTHGNILKKNRQKYYKSLTHY